MQKTHKIKNVGRYITVNAGFTSSFNINVLFKLSITVEHVTLLKVYLRETLS